MSKYSRCVTFNKKPKLKHLNRTDAVKHAMQYQEQTNHKIDYYKCRHCNYWHVGRRPASAKTKRMKRQQAAIDERLVGQLIEALKKQLPKRMQ